MKILLHINDNKNWEITLRSAEAALKHGRETSTMYAVEIVANGPAVEELQEAQAKKSGNYARFVSMKDAIRLCACNNALRNMRISNESLLPFVDVVPAGIIEIAERQQEGYAYIKP